VIVSNTENLWTGGIAARLQGIPHVQVVHSLTFKYRWHRLANIVKIYFRWLSLFANYFIGVSEAVKQMLMELGIEARKITVVPNGFDTKEIREKAGVPLPTGLEQLICGHHPVFISVSRIAPMKGQDVLIKAIARIRHIYPSVVCLMVGCRGADNGTEDTNRFFDDLKSEIQRLELQECIHFLGEVDYVPELLHRGDVYVHPSLTESFSRVVAEALICGKPVVSSDAGGIPETVGHHGALLVPAGDAEALSQALIRVLNEEPLRGEIVSRGQAYVEENYQASFTARKFSHVLSAVVENKVIGHGKRITSQTAS
jgi:glycosyltransferase involved in cell wall biosynthesis